MKRRQRGWVPWIAFDDWSHRAARWFVYDRVYWRGSWTPFVLVRWRHGFMRRNWN